VEAPSYASLHGLLGSPLVRLFLLAFIALPLFHWAHRFRYTLYDGLQLKHLTELIAVLCYGTALAGSAIAAYTLWAIP
jgi:fumarate reductase subunit D